MRRGRAIWREMPRIKLDTDTADRMLDGAVDALDVPPGYERVADLLQTLASRRTADRIAPRRVPATRAGRPGMRRSSVVLAAVCCLATGTAAYATGVPQTATHTASALLKDLGIEPAGDTPHPANHGAAVSAVAHDHASAGRAHGAAVSAVARSKRHEHSPRSGAHMRGGDGESRDHGAANGKGTDVSHLAHSTDPRGGRGSAVSSAASNGHSQAGQYAPGADTSSGTPANGGSQQAAHGGQAGGSSTTAR